MALTFKKAQKAQSKLRMSIAGPSGSGKTYSSLKIATEMGGKIAFIDTERGSAAKYSDIFDFDVIELDDFHPDRYIEAIKLAEKEGYDIIIIDSTTHEWNGKNGILELHEAAVQRQRTKNSYTAWAEITPLHNAFINAILQSKCHVIASVRSKTEYVQEKNDRGQTEIKKVGMASIQRADMDYEYDVMMELNIDHTGVITKTRCAALDGRTFKKPGRELAEILMAWLSDGTAVEEKATALDSTNSERNAVVAKMKAIYLANDKTEGQWNEYNEKELKSFSIEKLQTRLAAWEKAAAERAAQAAQPSENDVLIERIEAEFKTLDELGISKSEQDALVMRVTKGETLDSCDEETLKAVVEALVAATNEAKEGEGN